MGISNNLKSPSIFIGKQGKGILSFGSGQPDLPPPKEVVEAKNIRYDFRYGLKLIYQMRRCQENGDLTEEEKHRIEELLR